MLESVFNQTFTDFEIIIVNDGSTDNTSKVLKSISHQKVKIIDTENQGPAKARNLAIENATAPYILNLDADDKIAPDLLEKAYRIFSTNTNIGIVYCDAECFGAKSGKFEIGEYSLESMLFDNRITSLALFRKEDWLAVGGFSGDLVYGLEDWDFWLSIIETGREVVKIPDSLVYYRTYNEKNVSRSGKRKGNRRKMMESMVIIFNRHKKLYSSFPKAFGHFSEIERKLNNENFLVRIIKNAIYRFMQRHFWK
jgi:glycosyltransferase involved in cell wall biosynthesis